MSTYPELLPGNSLSQARGDIVTRDDCIRTLFASAVEPVPPVRVAYMLWLDTGSGILKQRNASDTAWINQGLFPDEYFGNLQRAGGIMTGNIDMNAVNKVINALDPSAPQEYATKNYVDTTRPGQFVFASRMSWPGGSFAQAMTHALVDRNLGFSLAGNLQDITVLNTKRYDIKWYITKATNGFLGGVFREISPGLVTYYAGITNEAGVGTFSGFRDKLQLQAGDVVQVYISTLGIGDFPSNSILDNGFSMESTD